MEATLTSLLSCADQALNFRDVFIFGHIVEVHMQGSQFVLTNRKLAICKDLSQSKLMFSIELVQRPKRGYNDVSIHERENAGCVIVDVRGCRDYEYYLINMHDINCQNNLLIVVL